MKQVVRSWWFAERSALAALIILGVGLSACSTARPLAPPASVPATDAWQTWGDAFRTAMDECVRTNVKNCLARAFVTRPRPDDNPAHTVAGDLARDLRTAQAMFAVPAAVAALKSEYGIEAPLYLGTGYSVPATPSAPGQYWQAQQREYFLPNLCAEPRPTGCSAQDSDIWTWHLTPGEAVAAADRPVAQLLTPAPTSGSRETLRQRLAETKLREDGLPNLLIRFGRTKFYSGTFGRPEAKRVFFADYAQLRDRTLRNTLTGTGSIALITGAEPGETFFVWVYAPAAQSEAESASWHALFAALEHASTSAAP